MKREEGRGKRETGGGKREDGGEKRETRYFHIWIFWIFKKNVVYLMEDKAIEKQLKYFHYEKDNLGSF